MDITKSVAKMRFKYHANMLNVCNVLNRFGIVKNEKANSVMKGHFMKALDCLDQMGYDVGSMIEKIEKKEP